MIIGRFAVAAVMAAGMLAPAGCSRAPGHLSAEERQRLVATADTPAHAPNAVAQPRLRDIVTYLEQEGIVREPVAVFELSNWLMYRQRMEQTDPMRPRYEGATFNYGKNRVALRIGPTTEPWQVPTPATEDMIVRSTTERGKRPDGATILLQGQEWAIGYTLELPDEAQEKRLTALLLDFAQRWREKPGDVKGTFNEEGGI